MIPDDINSRLWHQERRCSRTVCSIGSDRLSFRGETGGLKRWYPDNCQYGAARIDGSEPSLPRDPPSSTGIQGPRATILAKPRAVNNETGHLRGSRESKWEGEALIRSPRRGKSSFYLAERLVHFLPRGSSWDYHQERNDPLQKLKVEKIRDPGRMPPCHILWIFWGGVLFLKLVLSSCYFCKTPLLLYTDQCVMDSRAGNWCALGTQYAREITGILFHGRRSIMKPIKMSQF